MENDLVSLYESNYLHNGNLITEKFEKAEEADDDSDTEGATKTASVKKSVKKSKKSMSKKEIGGITYDSFKRSENYFDKLLREMDEMGGSVGPEVGGSDDVYDADSDGDFGDEGGDESISISELRNMTLGDLVALLAGGDDEDEFGSEDDFGGEDEIPVESYGFTGGEGNYKGDQGNYDGKAKRQGKSTFVKDNGDAEFGKQDTGYDPDVTEGSEGAEHGAQGNYDGKAKVQPKSDKVKGNGDADFGKSKTGYKTSSGKKEKNYF